MQEIKFLLREVGGESGMSANEVEEYIAYNFSSKGFKLWKQTEVPVLNGGKIASVQLFMTFVKDNEVSTGNVEGGSEDLVDEAPKKRGRPARGE